MKQTGMTLKQYAARRFADALDQYRLALKSGPEALVAASIEVYLARRNEADRRAINRVWREVMKERKP
jgi:hypothetical protein